MPVRLSVVASAGMKVRVQTNISKEICNEGHT